MTAECPSKVSSAVGGCAGPLPLGKIVLRKAHSPHGVYLFSCYTELFLLNAQGAHLGIGRRTLQHDSTSDLGTRLGARHIPFQFESPAGFPPR